MLCFMAIEKDVNGGDVIEVDDDNPSYADLLCAFEELHGDMKNYQKE